MQYKLVAGVAGAIGYGALVGWALTADHYEQKLINSKLTNNALRDMLHAETQRFSQPDAVTTKFDPTDAVVMRSKIELPTQFDKEFEESVEDFRKELEEEVEKAESVAENLRGDVTSDEVVTGDEEDAEDPPSETPEETRSNLQSLIDHYTADEDEVEQFVAKATRERDPDYSPPFVISKEKYAWDEEEGDDFDKITLTYYPNARLVLDDDEDVMEDVARILGWKNLQRFGDESGDADVVFIRNRQMMTDFEVIRDEESDLPLHVKYGMPRDEFETNKAAGLIKFRPEDNG